MDDVTSNDDFALLSEAVDVTTQELYDHSIAHLNDQVHSAHAAFDAIASGDVVTGTIRKSRKRKRRTPRQIGYTAT